MTPTRRVLMIAYYFPPIGGIGSIRAARFAEYLPEFSWEPTVLAPAQTPHALDTSLAFGDVNVARSRSLEVSELVRGLPGARIGATGKDRGRVQARAAIRRLLLYPDAQLGWYPSARKVGVRLTVSERFDAVFSSSFPITAHLVARSISRHARIPWVAEFRDPWSDRLPAFPYRGRADKLERSISRNARAVVMPSPAWAEHFGARWGREVQVIPNGCDPPPDTQPPSHDAILAHVGSYYPGRQRLAAVWGALAALRDSRVSLPRIRWVGELPAEALAELDRHGLADTVEVTGFVSHHDAVRLLNSASMLFASGPCDPGPIGRGWLPAKLFEYIASGLPLLYVGDLAGDAARLLGGYPGCFVVRTDDVDGARRALESGLASGRCERDIESVTRQTRTRALADVLNAVLPA